MKMKKGSLAVLLLLMIVLVPAWSIEIKVSDSRENNFYMDALYWVLDKSGQEYQITYTEHPVSSQQRKIIQLKQGDIDLLYAGTSIELEHELLPVRFPIMRGLIGRRLFIINNRYQKDYDSVNNLNDLKGFVGIQGIGWGDTRVLEASDLPQIEKLYDDIFINLNAGSRYYFPRGMTEVFAELQDKKLKLPDIELEQKILLSYKTAVFFFVNPSNKALKEALDSGFQKGYEDGSYEQFFYNHSLITTAFENAQLDNRTLIEIDNPFLSKETKAIPAGYWHIDPR